MRIQRGDWLTRKWIFQQRLSDGHLDAVRAKEGGLDAQFFSIWVEPELFGGGGARAMRRADEQIQAVHETGGEAPETWELATTAADIRRIAAAGKIAALMGMEGGYAIDEKIENVDRYYRLGVRYLSPAWSVSTSWAGSLGDEVGKTRGLNDFGKQVIREMNSAGYHGRCSIFTGRTRSGTSSTLRPGR